MKLPDELVERAIKAAQEPFLVTADGRHIRISDLLTTDHPELLEKVVRAALEAALSEGGEIVNLDDGYDFEDSTGLIVGLDPGRYLVIPLERTEEP